MATAQPLDFAGLMAEVAPLLCGSPNAKMSKGTRLRFGTHGSMEVDTGEGWFHDHEAEAKGGLLALIQHKQGCDMSGALSWLEEQGLKERDVPSSEVWQLGAHRTGPVFYDYRDESGAILSRVKRTPDKRFFQLGPDGKGGFHSVSGCMEGVRRVPYRLPELLAADANRTAFIVEGEKDADRLATLGFVATSSAEGAGKFRSDLIEHFAGRKVVVIADNDQPGRDHAADVAAKLGGIAAAVSILELPGLPLKGDVSDWLDAGGTVETLKVLAKAALNNPATSAAASPLVSATPYLFCLPEMIPARDWVYGRSIQRGHVRAIVAQGAAGKTILSIGEALAMVTGRDLLGQSVQGGPKRVWLWNLEDDREELSRIIQAACKHWQISEADIAGRLFVDSALDGAILKLARSTGTDGLVINRPLVEALTAEMIARGIDYLHVDPFVSSHSANENDNMEIDAIAKEWATVAKNAKAGIGLAHHVSKAGALEATALSGRGAVALINACRSVLVLNRMNEVEADRYGIEEDRRRRFFRTYDDKNNRAPPSDASDWFHMHSVSLGNGPTGGDGDSIGVVVPWSPPDAFEGVSPDHLYQVQCAVAERAETNRYRVDVQASAWVGKVVAEVLDLSPEASNKGDRRKLNSVLKTWIETGALVKVEGKDARSNDRTFIEVGTWAVQGVSPPRNEQVGTGGEGEDIYRPHLTSPIKGGGGEDGTMHRNSEVGKSNFVAGNPALGLIDKRPRF